MFRRTIKRAISKLPRKQYEPYNYIELSRKSLLHNLALFQSQNVGHSIIPVVKGNAYGHGIREIAKILNEATLDLLAVDGYFEAEAIRDITKHRILVMGAIKPTNSGLVDTKKCSFVIQDIEALRAFGKLKRPVNIHLELNTGMQRLGLNNNQIDEYLNVINQYPNLKLEGVMSHLADADSRDNSFTLKQEELFNRLVEHIKHRGFTPKYIHLAQTAGSAKVQKKYTNALRLGIGLFGINPLPDDDPKYHELDGLKPVMELKSTIIKVQKVQNGDKVSYNGIFTATKPMRVGILPLGYYEGYPRDLSNRGIVLYEGAQLKVVGRVCMNHTIIDITGTNADVGSIVTLISNNSSDPNSIAGLRRGFNLFAYTLATGHSEHIRRIIV